MFSYTLLKAHFRAGLFADWVSGANKHDGSLESALDKRSKGATNREWGVEKDERETAALDGSGSLSGWLGPVSD